MAALIVGALVVGNGLVSCAGPPRSATTPSRPVTAAEASRLARVRLTDYDTGHAGVVATIGTGTGAVHVSGWVDWRQPLVYLNVVGANTGPDDGIVQAIPGVVAFRPGLYQPQGAGLDPAPPVPAPPTGWQIRPIQPGSALDTMITLLFSMRSATLDSASQIAAIGTRFVGTDVIRGDGVDVLDGPAVPPTNHAATGAPPTTHPQTRTPTIHPVTGAPTRTPTPTDPATSTPPPTPPAAAAPSPSQTPLPFAAEGGQVRYWIDAQSLVLRVEALVDPTTTLRIDFNRADGTDPSAIELLGGPVNTPTPLTAPELALLGHMRLRDGRSGGGTFTLAVPVSRQQLFGATGWIDWQAPAVYATVRNFASTAPDATLRADDAGITLRGILTGTPGQGAAVPLSTAPPSIPPLSMPPLRPSSIGWTRTAWSSFDQGEPDLDLLLHELLRQASSRVDDPADLEPIASRLRSDTVDGVPVTVYEIRQPNEVNVPPGYGRLRFWVDATGLLRRLELRTRIGAYAYVTITPGPVPTLPNPTRA